MKIERKCHNCKGVGVLPTMKKREKKDIDRIGKCLYCKGKGYRFSNYGADR